MIAMSQIHVSVSNGDRSETIQVATLAFEMLDGCSCEISALDMRRDEVIGLSFQRTLERTLVMCPAGHFPHSEDEADRAVDCIDRCVPDVQLMPEPFEVNASAVKLAAPAARFAASRRRWRNLR